MPRRIKPLSERFWQRVNKSGPIVRPELGECWEWTGAMNGAGYGALLLNGRGSQACRAHRVAFFLADGRWPDPCALHHCDNRKCVRRSHLYEGTKAENVVDMMTRGRHVVGRRYSGEANGFAKLKDSERAEVRAMRVSGVAFQAIADRFGITKQGAMYIVKRGVA